MCVKADHRVKEVLLYKYTACVERYRLEIRRRKNMARVLDQNLLVYDPSCIQRGFHSGFQSFDSGAHLNL